MKQKQFDEIVNKQLNECKKVLLNKGHQYSLDDDRLSHFKRSANLMNTNEKQALFNMLTKHLISISDMCLSKTKFDLSLWNEKITDSINYLIILRAIVEEKENEKYRS